MCKNNQKLFNNKKTNETSIQNSKHLKYHEIKPENLIYNQKTFNLKSEFLHVHLIYIKCFISEWDHDVRKWPPPRGGHTSLIICPF